MDENLRLLIITVLLAPIVFFFVNSPLRAAVYIIIFQKIIDIFWFIKVQVGPFQFSPQRIIYTLIPIVLILILFFVASSRSREIRLSPPKALIGAISIFTLWFFLNIFRGTEQIFAIEGFSKALGGYVMLAVGWFYFDGKDTDKKFDEFARLYVLTFFIPVLGVFLQFFGLFELADIGVRQQTQSSFGLEEFNTRYAGFYNDSGTAAMYVWAGLPLALYLLSKKEEKFKWIYLLSALSMVMVIILGFGRGMYLTLGLLLASWLFINKRYFVLLLGAIVVVIFFFISPFFEKFFRDLFLIAETGRLSAASMSGKGLIWETEIELFLKGNLFDQFFGKGLGQSAIDISNTLVKDINSDMKISTESEFFYFRYELGYLGWIPFVVIPFLLCKAVYSNILAAHSLKLDPLLMTRYYIAFSLSCVLMISLFGGATRWVSMTFPLWFLMGFALKHPAFYVLKAASTRDNFSFESKTLVTS
ncbi:MAG: hypothetical protein SNJ66_10905 [Chloroherpetonaceae bacterium]